MGDHVNTKKDTTKHHKAGFSEGKDIRLERARRTSFKSYVQNLEEELLEQELEAEEWIVEQLIDGEWREAATFTTEDEALDEMNFNLHELESIPADELRVTKV